VTGRLVIAGLGPAGDRWITPAAASAVREAEDLFGYKSYLDRLPIRAGQIKHASDNREELARARSALALAATGRQVTIVSGGDPGVFAMASAVCEAIEHGEPAWREIDIVVEPGITAMLAAAARVGAPLGHDFCAISLSDNLKPWTLIKKRLALAVEADLVLALYNPASRARPRLIVQVFELLGALRPPHTLVLFATAVGRPEENIDITTLAAANPRHADMRTLIIVGASGTRIITRPNRVPLIYTERFARVS
jgi:precorrin-3B C17-methyltransferase